MAVYICVKCREIVPEKGLKKHRCEKAVVNTRDLMDQLGPRTELQARHNQAGRDGAVLTAYYRGMDAGRELERSHRSSANRSRARS